MSSTDSQVNKSKVNSEGRDSAMGQKMSDEINLVSCSLHNGESASHKIRRRCGGLDIYGQWRNVTITWGPGFTKSGMLSWEIERAFFWFINIVLLLVVVTGVINFVFILSSFGTFIDFNFWVSTDLSSSWIGLLAACFLGYRLINFIQANSAMQKILLDKGVNKYTIELSNLLSREGWQVLKYFWKSVNKLNIATAQPIHLFRALLEFPTIISLFIRLGINVNQAKKLSDIVIQRVNKERQKGSSMSIDPVLKESLFRSFGIAMDHQLDHIEPQNILLALVNSNVNIKEIFAELNIEAHDLAQVINWFDIDRSLQKRYKRFHRFAILRPKSTMNRAMTAVATQALDMFSQDLTRLASSGYLTMCIGREKVLKEIFRLAEGGNKNMILVGAEGIGKTTIIGALAEMMITDDVPELLKDKRLVSLSIPKLLAGANAPGMVEQRLLAIRDEIMRSGNIVLFIDNIHDLVGSTTSNDAGLDASELVASIMERGNFPIIATSNHIDYRRFIESKALGAVMQHITVPEPTQDETVAILQSQAAFIENKFKVYFSYKSLVKIVELADRYIYDQVFPEKALRLMEEVAIFMKNKTNKATLIVEEDVATLVSDKINIPLTQISNVESEQLLNMEDIIHERLINQDMAVKAVASALRRARTELRDEGRPIVNLLFLGPTGVGKTELAKIVASVYFGSEHEILRLDMSEYQNKDSINRLIGSESNQGGYLTEGVRQKPYTVLLLDELEKAHPDILNIFLQVMDDGRLTDWSGRTIDFTNLIIIATSNAGTQFIQDSINSDNTNMEAISNELMQNKLKNHFRPEFLNRFDKIVVFSPLTREHIRKVASLMLIKNAKRLETKGIQLKVTEGALDEMAQAGYDPLYGARPMRRLIQETVDDAIAKFLLTGSVTRRDTVVLDKGGEIRVKKGSKF